jgi:hypothetical protein
MNSAASKDCFKKAGTCLQQASHDPGRREHWLRQAEELTRRARTGSSDDRSAPTHEVCEGKMIPKPST